jgi:hypothetical protein
MTWFFLFIFSTNIGIHGPFETKERCLEALAADEASAWSIDPRFYANAVPPKARGVCFEGAITKEPPKQ